MNLQRMSTLIIVLMGILWFTMTGLAWAGYWFPALFVLLGLLLLLLMLGTAKHGKLDSRIFLFPLLTWIGVWAFSFIMAQHYAQRFAGEAPDFSILGFHPSFAWIILAYWLGGTAVLALGYYFIRDRWLSEAEWKAFISSIAEANEQAEDN